MLLCAVRWKIFQCVEITVPQMVHGALLTSVFSLKLSHTLSFDTVQLRHDRPLNSFDFNCTARFSQEHDIIVLSLD